MTLFEIILTAIEACFSAWGLAGIILGIAAAAIVWHLSPPESRERLASIAFLSIFIGCLLIEYCIDSKD